MNVLGISCYFHDAAAALLRDGQLIAAAEEERFSRKKHDYEYPEHAIDFCLRTAKITAADLDYVVFFEKPSSAKSTWPPRPSTAKRIRNVWRWPSSRTS